MSLYHLECDIVVKAYTTVEADTLPDAIRLSEHRHSLVSGFGGDDVTTHWVINNVEGVLTRIKQA